MSRERILQEMQKLGQGTPNKDWAYDVLRRRGKDPNVTPAALKIAEEAVRLDQFARVQEIENAESGNEGAED